MAKTRWRSFYRGKAWLVRTATLLGALALIASGSAVAAREAAPLRFTSPDRSPIGSGALATAAVDVRVSSSPDDAEQQISTGEMYLNSSDIELVEDVSDRGVQAVGLRFQGVTVPRRATILRAYIEFTADEIQREATALQFHGQAADNAPTFAPVSNDITSRHRTSAFVTWDPVPVWPVVDEVHQTPDLSPIVQEIVDRSGWSWGQAMVFLVSGSGTRTAAAYDWAPSAAALLHIEYSSGSGDQHLAFLPLVTRRWPHTCTLYVINNTGCELCYEVFGSGIGQKCYTTPGKNFYGSFPANTYNYQASACCGTVNGTGNYGIGTYQHPFSCGAEMGLKSAPPAQ